MSDPQTLIMLSIFALMVLFLLWRPFGINESIPASLSALCILLLGIVPTGDISKIFGIISGASITILSTIAMSIVLESIGFFRWASFNLAIKAKGSGILLFWNINLLCFLMTLFFNNDGSILITTPIIIQTLSLLRLKPHQKIPFLISGALVATASSAPIGVSNLANLIALKMVGLDLNLYAAMMIVPSMLGLSCMAFFLYLYFKKDIPIRVSSDIHWLSSQERKPESVLRKWPHPLVPKSKDLAMDWRLFRLCIFIVVFTRISFFALAPLGIPTEWPAVAGAILLIIIRWNKKRMGPWDVLKKSPWHIFLFAFSMYVIIYGLHNTRLTTFIVQQLGGVDARNPLHAIFTMGLLLTVLSNMCNNLPSVMIGTLSIKDMGWSPPLMQVAYLGNVLGSDLGALILPIGTLATLIWLHILRQHKIPMSWRQYVKVTILVIPSSLILSLLALYVWTESFFF